MVGKARKREATQGAQFSRLKEKYPYVFTKLTFQALFYGFCSSFFFLFMFSYLARIFCHRYSWFYLLLKNYNYLQLIRNKMMYVFHVTVIFL